VTPSMTVSELRTTPPHRLQMIDVRSTSEFAAGHVPGAVNIPMDQVEARLDDLYPDMPIVFICQAGKRARMTAGLLQPCQREVAVLEGGTNAWIKAGFPVVRTTKTRWSLERQVRFGAGLLMLCGLTLALAVTPYWLLLSAFVGLGLTFAGLTDICPMAILLAKLPWNKRSHCALALPNAEPCGGK
jgi:rhodanese-related sulfurtransferase